MVNRPPDWLREHMRERIANFPAAEVEEDNIGSVRPYPTKNSGSAVLDLISQAAELIGDVDHYATERENRVESLAEKAIDELKVANDRVRSADAARRVAEAELKELTDRLDKAEIRLQQATTLIERMASLVSATEARLATAEQQATAAEARANEVEGILKDVEEAIRSKILGKMPSDFVRKVARAA
jgi:chromosome segregation ATPase